MKLHIRTLALMLLLLAGGMANEAWAYKVTYYILTLPLDHSKGTANTKSTYDGWRMEAIRVVINDASNIELPAHFKSPLAKNFTFYPKDVIKKDGTAHDIYQNNNKNKYFLYKAPLAPYIKVTVTSHAITNEVICTSDAWTAAESTYQKTATSYANMESQVASLDDGDYFFSFQDQCLSEGDEIPSNNYEVYVTYEYNAANTIAKLDGSKVYNIALGDGFLALNRGRNNRPAVVATKYLTADQLASDEFVKVNLSDGKSGITTYWKDNSGNNKNKQEDVESQFHFQFVYEGEDPYNITIRSAYNKNTYYIEKDTYDSDFVRKYYKGAVLFGNSVGNKIYLASDVDVKYKTVYNSGEADADLTLVDYDEMPGYYRGYSPLYNSFALLSSKAIDPSKNGYVFMGTRIFNNNGSFKDPGAGNYYYLNSSHDNPWYAAMTPNTAVGSHSTDLYSITTVNFKVPTPFYNLVGTDEWKAAHTLTASIDMSEYKFSTADISDADIPASLKRKYCNINHYYKDAARTQEITKYSDLGEGRDIYLGYEVSMPFQTIRPAASYSSATWTAASWYELTDAESSQVDGKKLKYDGSANFKNNGPDGEYEKTSEFAFIGDPYELRVISRSETSGAAPSYVGVASNSPSSGTAFTANTTAYDGNVWEIPNDDTEGSFLLRKYKGEGHWNWNAGHRTEDVTYGADPTVNEVSNAQTITFNISGLTGGKYFKVTKGGTNAAQVVSTLPALDAVVEEAGTTATVTVTLSAADAAKTMTITIQEYNDAGGVTPSDANPTVITINQSTTAFTGNAVEYNTSSSTRIKVMELPTRTFTYNIVNLEGNVAAKASVSQTIFSPLSLASIPSIIVSPFLVGETLTFYSTYSGGGRGNLSDVISETSNDDHDIFVTYTTAHLREKPILLSEDQEFFVKLNGQYIYYDAESDRIKSSATSLEDNKYKWLLRARDPYGMLIDNLAARDAKSVSGREDVTLYEDDGTPNSTTRNKGAWVRVDGGTWGNDKDLVFTTTRSEASRFIAKSSGALGTSIYEVMAADGSVDASTTYYNIGRSAVDVVKIYSNATYVHGHDVLKFDLEANARITYHLIDKSKSDLVQVDSRSPDLYFPNEFRSPLVATYHYWQASAFVDADPEGGTNFNFTGSPSELSSVGDLTDAKYNTPVASDESTWTAAAVGLQKTATTEDNMIAQVKLLTATGTYIFKIGSDTYKSVTVTEGHKISADIYVTYDTDEQFSFGTKSPYTLKFLNGESYKLEDGNDKLTSTKLKAVYPYCNGDGHLNIYGQRMNDEQMNGGSSTRPRWVWFMESENHDPYHVKIHSRSTISFNGASNSTYLQTYAVHFNQETDAPNKQRIITGGNLSGISQVAATEYMILGEKIPDEPTKYKLLTTNPVAADLDGDGNTSGTGENERQYVTSFEQYWKTYNMLKQHVLGISKSADEFSEDPETFVMPSSKLDDLKDALDELDINGSTEMNYVDGCVWHSYNAAANALRWNGFDDNGKANTKKVEILEHWFQTFDMGDGTFEIESADIPPVLVLLDRHGWEIMRKQLPTSSDEEKLAALRAYDSPMVKEYQFYNNATKAANCHKYTLRTQNGALRDEIKVDGKAFTSTSLGTLPTLKADQFGTYPDVYVTYTVKDEYEKSYKYTYNEDTDVETGTPSKFLIVINSRYARNKVGDTQNYLSKPVSQATNPAGGNVYDMILNPSRVEVGNVTVDANGDGKIDDNNFWYVQPNLAIDDEMGIPWASEEGSSNEPLTRIETKKKYKDKTGFDPYNIQLKNVGTNEFFTMNLTSTELSNGGWKGTLGANGITLAAATSSGFVEPEGYDHTTLKITKQTFMAVSDVNGNMQLMPRFDHSKRIQVNTGSPNYFTTLANPVNHAKAEVTDNSSMGPQTVFFVRPQVFNYHIIDNDGNEALRYKSAGEYEPFIPEKLKSPLAKDFKYYYDHAAYTTVASSAAAYTAAASSTAFKLSAANEDAMKTTADALEVLDDFYFKVGVESPYSYKKVTVTKAHSGSDKAVYSVNNSTENEWTNAVAVQQTVANEAAMETAILSLASKGFYYYKIGPYYSYNKVVRSSGKNTITASNSGEYSGSLTATDQTDFTTKAAALSSDGTYYYKIGPQYDYRKVVVTNPYDNITTEIAAGQDISVREIKSTFAEAELNDDENDVYVRYSYHESADVDADNILQGNWFTMNLAGKDVQSSGSIVTEDDPATDGVDERGTGVSLFADEATPTKPATINEVDATRKWQWKFIAANKVSESPDPYAVHIYNRKANYSASFVADPNPMGVGIKVNGRDRFAILSHPAGGYALAVAGLGSYTNSFLNGASMTSPSTTAATTVEECYQKIVSTNTDYEALKTTLAAGADAVYYIKINGTEVSDIPQYKRVTITSHVAGEVDVEKADWENAYISPGAKLILNDDVDHNYVYHVITNDASGNKLAISETQTKAEAEAKNFAPELPENIQTPLLNLDDYDYYGGATETSGSYTMIDATKLHTVYGLYDDVVYVRYKAYNPDNTGYLVPNKKTVVDSKVARDAGSNDVPLDINGKLPYNIYWYNDNMMYNNSGTISAAASHDLSGDANYIWLIEGNDPYALQIKHKASGKYADGTATLNVTSKNFMLLKKTGYDYGILQETGGVNKLTGYGHDLTSGDPTKFIMFGLSTHKLIYHLVINTTNVNTSIPYRTGTESSPGATLGTKDIPGTTQRDLVSENEGAGLHYAGEKYQLGSTIMGRTYSVDAGEVSLGDDLLVPDEFNRPNCVFFFYIHNIQKHGDTEKYQKTAATYEAMETAAASLASDGYYYYNVGDGTSYYRAHKDEDTPIIVDCTVDDWNNAWQDDATMNNLYKGLEVTKLMSDAGLIGGLVNVNVAYAFQTGLETNAGEGFVTSVDQNLWYTFEAQDGTTPFLAHYTNAWGLQAMEGRETRYTNDYLWTPLGDVYGFRMYNRYMIKNSGGTANVMTMSSISEGQNLLLHLPDAEYTVGNEVFELLKSNNLGFFRIHPVINHTGTRYYIRKDPSDNYAKLSTTSSEWTFNLTTELLSPYIERVGYVGGLKETTYTANKPVLDRVKGGTADYADMLAVQGIVYNDANIVKYVPGYYRLHSQPGVSGISPVRYASGYLHKTELTGDGSLTTAAIPIHFYSKKGSSTTFETLENGFTYSHATRGPIPVPATEYDPSSVFYFNGPAVAAPANPVSTMQTQGLYVAETAGNGLGTNKEKRAVMSASSGNAINLTLMDIGGAVLLIHDGTAPATRKYLNFDQTNAFQKTATDASDYNTKKLGLTSVGVYYFKYGSTYKKVTVTALDPYAYSETDANATDWERAADIYDLKYYHESPTDDAKWCMEPANNQGLLVETHSGGDGYYYATFYAPYDLQLPADVTDKTPAKHYYAYICTDWNTQMLRPKKTGNSGKNIPANTPVIIRTDDNSGSVKLSFPASSLSAESGNIFTGSYLEQLLESAITASDKVYTMGLPITGYGLVTDEGSTNGNITDIINRSQDYTGVGFYINATQNKELSEETGQWTPNNRYVLHNKIYYRGGGGSSREDRDITRGVQFVPVVFDDGIEEEDNEDDPTAASARANEVRIYDLQGRRRTKLQKGLNIVNGKKVVIN